MKRFVAAAFLMTALISSAVSVRADFTSWENSSYPFAQVKSVYVAEMDTSEVSLNQVKAQKAKAFLDNKLMKLSLPSSFKLTSEFSNQVYLPASKVQKASEENGESNADPLLEAVEASGADVYIIPRLTHWHVDSYIIPAHTEWRSRKVKDAWKDKDGNWHEYYRTETYPEFIPDQAVPYSEVTVSFEWYDRASGKLIASSEDARVRDMENNPQGIYERIIERFVKNLKKTLKK